MTRTFFWSQQILLLRSTVAGFAHPGLGHVAGSPQFHVVTRPPSRPAQACFHSTGRVLRARKHTHGHAKLSSEPAPPASPTFYWPEQVTRPSGEKDSHALMEEGAKPCASSVNTAKGGESGPFLQPICPTRWSPLLYLKAIKCISEM